MLFTVEQFYSIINRICNSQFIVLRSNLEFKISIQKSTIVLTSTNEVVYGLWNTFVGQNRILSTPGSDTGTCNPNEILQNVFDQNITTKYTSYGISNRYSNYSFLHD